jgi:hypothetical protein
MSGFKIEAVSAFEEITIFDRVLKMRIKFSIEAGKERRKVAHAIQDVIDKLNDTTVKLSLDQRFELSEDLIKYFIDFFEYSFNTDDVAYLQQCISGELGDDKILDDRDLKNLLDYVNDRVNNSLVDDSKKA